MRKIRVKELNPDDFRTYGSFSELIEPEGERIGKPPIEFFRDRLQLDLGTVSAASFSTCRVEVREPVIDTVEYHTACGEGILPLDGDVLVHLGPATPPDEGPPLERIEVFRVPQGTMVILRPGVWHHAPFAAGDAPVNTMIVLPERTYANDCEVVELSPEQQLEIETG